MDQKCDDDDVWEGIRLAGVAVVSALVVAAVVIVAGKAFLPEVSQPVRDVPAVIRVSASH